MKRPHGCLITLGIVLLLIVAAYAYTEFAPKTGEQCVEAASYMSDYKMRLKYLADCFEKVR